MTAERKTDKGILSILKIYFESWPRGGDTPQPRFKVRDLEGRKIIDHRQIQNPENYDPKVESANPLFFLVQDYEDGSFLLIENWGDGECEHQRYYLWDEKTAEVSFSDSRLFKPDLW